MKGSAMTEPRDRADTAPRTLWDDLDAESRKPGPTMTITKAQYLALREAADRGYQQGQIDMQDAIHAKESREAAAPDAPAPPESNPTLDYLRGGRPKGDVAAALDRALNGMLREGVNRDTDLWPMIYEYAEAEREAAAPDAPAPRRTASEMLMIRCAECAHKRVEHPDGAACTVGAGTLACACTEYIWPAAAPAPQTDAEYLAAADRREALDTAWPQLREERRAAPDAPAPQTNPYPHDGFVRDAWDQGFAAGRTAAPAPQALDVERLVDLWVAAHSSNREGQRAGHEMYAMVEDWWDANRADPYPLPRMSRLPSETGE